MKEKKNKTSTPLFRDGNKMRKIMYDIRIQQRYPYLDQY